MWMIQHQNYETYSVLFCQPTTPHPKGITSIRILNINGQQLQFEIASLNLVFINDMHNRLDHIDENFKYTSTTNGIIIEIDISENLESLITLLRLIDDRINDFAQIRTALPLIVDANKMKLIEAHKAQLLTIVPTIESQAENTMRAPLCATTRSSELALRAKYKFEAPMYSWFFKSSTPTPSALEDDDEIEEGEEEVIYDEEYEQDDQAQAAAPAPGPFGFLLNYANHPQTTQVVEQLDEFENNTEYTKEENELIEDLIKRLEGKQQNLIDNGYLMVNERTQIIVLTKQSKEILIAARTNPNIRNAHSANLALDVKTALRALNQGGSYSHNHAMYRTGITGYGLRNIVALLWHCCREAGKNNTFMIGVKPFDGFRAIIRGITNGARDGNRLKEYDDLSENDHQACDSGKFNSLIVAFMGIFEEVQIIFNFTEALRQELKTYIAFQITEATNDYAQACTYRALWAGESVLEPQGFKEFVTTIKNNVPEVISKYLLKICPYDPILREQIKEEIEREIRNVEEVNLGLTYIEIVEPLLEDLKYAWKKAYPLDTSPFNDADEYMEEVDRDDEDYEYEEDEDEDAEFSSDQEDSATKYRRLRL